MEGDLQLNQITILEGLFVHSPDPFIALPGIIVFANKFSANGEYL